MILDDYSPMPYGKFKGVEMANVPAEYLIYLHEHGKCSFSVQQYINENMDALRKEVNNV